MTLEPIGVIRSPFHQAAGTPIQPRAAGGAAGEVEIFPKFAAGLKDLEGFERIWILYWFDRANFDERRLTVIPYLDSAPRGLFATRAPARPNPIGMSSVRLLEVCGNILKVADVDMLDGTPVLDIKPYVERFDSYEGVRSGWLEACDLQGKVADSRFEVLPIKKRVLFLCTGNSARSQMAEGLLRHLAGDRFEVFSAGTHPVGVNPAAVEVMREIGVDISHHRSKGVDEFVGQEFDCIFTVCDRAREACPIFPGVGKRLHHSFEDPVAAPPGKRLEAFRQVRDQIVDRLKEFIASGR
jgi:tRNA-Thr(GGU) m(6)t(6)A37 methyltransferase TsaA/thioredoxin type arsenate reductase